MTTTDRLTPKHECAWCGERENDTHGPVRYQVPEGGFYHDACADTASGYAELAEEEHAEVEHRPLKPKAPGPFWTARCSCGWSWPWACGEDEALRATWAHQDQQGRRTP